MKREKISMNDDLVKRLRDTANSGGYDIYGLHCDLELEAAARIEKLEAALRAAMEDTPGWYDLARAALGEKKDG